MKFLPFQTVMELSGGTYVGPAPPPEGIAGVSIDTRTIREGELFVPLEGKRTDGHLFLKDAFVKGAAAAFCRRGREGEFPGKPLLVVEDPFEAMVRLAREHRRRMPAKWIGITGSCGKTTVKEMLAHILSSFSPVVKSPKSYNNELGVPLTLLEADSDTKWGIAELGTNAPGEIGRLAGWVEPRIGLVTCIGDAHLEKLGDREGVFREKSQLWRALPEEGIAVWNADDPFGPRVKEVFSGETVSFGIHRDADVRGTEIETDGEGIRFKANGVPCRLNLHGEFQAANALAALAAARAAGVDVKQGAVTLSSFAGMERRGRVHRLPGGTLIDDCYNANPTSIEAGVNLLRKWPSSGRRVAVIGDMLELGELSDAFHRRILEQAGNDAAVTVVGVGPRMRKAALSMEKGTFSFFYENAAEAAAAVPEWLCPGDVILVKGSREMHLESVVDAVLDIWE